HRGISESAATVRVQLRLAARDLDLRAGVLPLEPVVFPAHAGARAGVPQKEPGELVPEVLHGPCERASVARRLLLAARRYAGGIARDRTVVPEDHGVFESIAG